MRSQTFSPIGVLSLLLLTSAAGAGKVCAQSTPRSDTRIRFVDDRKLPQQSIRRRSGGWEARGPHIAAFSPNSSAEAKQIVSEMEATWSEAAGLADSWMKTHRQPNFGVGSVNVRVLKRGQEPPHTKKSRVVFLESVDNRDRATTVERAFNVRRAAVRTFFDVTEMNVALPEWVQDGLTSYLVGQRASTLAQETNHTHRPSAAWARALLETDDGKHAWKLFDALAAATSSRMTSRAQARMTAEFSANMDARKVAQAWINDPLTGQPLLKAPLRLDAEVRPIVADMLEVLKLDRRFAPRTTRPVRPKVVGTGLLPADPWANEKPPTHWSMRATRDRLLSPTATRWATIDAHGRLVTSRNGADIEALFDRAERRFVPIADGKKRMLRATLHDGRIVEGWLEDNRENPNRPILTIRVMQPGSLGKPRDKKATPKKPASKQP